MTAPAPNRAARKMKDTTSPCTVAAAALGPAGGWARKLAVALAATVLSRAAPSDPPTWLLLLTRAAATPVSAGRVPAGPRLKAETTAQPTPRPRRTSAGATTVA